MIETIFEDTRVMLEDDFGCWVAFCEPVWMANYGVFAEAFGVYHFLADWHVFWVGEYGPQTLIIAPGRINRENWYYTQDESIVLPFLRKFTDTTRMLRVTTDSDRKAGL